MQLVNVEIGKCQACNKHGIPVLAIESSRWSSLRFCESCLLEMVDVIRKPTEPRESRGVYHTVN